MSKYFTNIDLMMRDPLLGPPDDFMFKSKKVELGAVVMNSIRRSTCRDILTYTIAPQTITIKENTSPWDEDMIGLQLTYLVFKPDYLDKVDLNMMELSLDVSNTSNFYAYVFAREMRLINKETKEEIPINDIFLYPQTPLFTLGPEQKVSLTCSFEKMSKTDAESKGLEASSRHQGGTIGMEYETITPSKEPSSIEEVKENIEEKVSMNYDPDKDPEEIRFIGNIQYGLDPKNLIREGMDRLIEKLTIIQDAVTNRQSDKFYLQINRYLKYDFVFIGEDNTVGSLIEKWINRKDPTASAGYRQTKDRKAITIDFGLNRFIPEILQDKISSGNLEEVVEKSSMMIDQKKEEEQRLETIRTFLGHLKDIQRYLTELRDDWMKVSINEVSTEDFMEEIHRLREERKK